MPEVINRPQQELLIAERLKAQWSTLVKSAGGKLSLLDSEFSKMVREYQSGGRVYHNLFHIGKVDEVLNRYRHLARNFVALKFAGDGHDVIYIPGSKTNEEDSASHIRGVMTKLGMPASIVTETERIILITKDHKTTDDDIDGKLMIDADFVIFASPEVEYDAYARGIWQEYVDSGKVSKDAFREGREKLVRNWLKRDRLFLIDEIQKESGFLARKNLERELILLTS
ncbi:MAG: hypothetical protein Q7R31_03155 [Candidatus Levybacteria bacterium]|nr:hypothetical protein [Candidatus Levybacteria bacterium]